MTQYTELLDKKAEELKQKIMNAFNNNQREE